MRTTVYLPDDLGNRLEKWRDELNVSSILQEALSREINRLEARPENFPDLEATVARLKGEKVEWEEKWYRVGLRLGSEWASKAEYPSLLYYGEEWAKERRKRNPRLPVGDPVSLILTAKFGPGEVDADFVGESGLLEDYSALKDIFHCADQYGWYEAQYDRAFLARGWLDGVEAFWDEVKKQL